MKYRIQHLLTYLSTLSLWSSATKHLQNLLKKNITKMIYKSETKCWSYSALVLTSVFFQLSFFTNNQNTFKTYWSGHRGLLQLEKKMILVQVTNDKGGHYGGPFLASIPLSSEELHGLEKYDIAPIRTSRDSTRMVTHFITAQQFSWHKIWYANVRVVTNAEIRIACGFRGVPNG